MASSVCNAWEDAGEVIAHQWILCRRGSQCPDIALQRPEIAEPALRRCVMVTVDLIDVGPHVHAQTCGRLIRSTVAKG